MRRSHDTRHCFLMPLPHGLIVLILSVMATIVPGIEASENPERELLRSRLEQLSKHGSIEIRGARIIANRILPEFYHRRDFALAWTEPARIESAIELAAGLEADGLHPEDAHAPTLRQWWQDSQVFWAMPSDARVDLDILLTDSLIRVSLLLYFGRVDPVSLDSNWNFKRSLGGEDPVDFMEAAIQAESLHRYVDDALKRPDIYQQYKDALKRYRALKDAGGWPQIPEGPVLEPGSQGERVGLLRRRLNVADAEMADANRFDDSVAAAVRTFQKLHGLERDGRVGPATLRALNMTVEQRIDQIRVNLERLRWVIQDVPSDFVLVDIAGFHVYLYRNDRLVWQARAQVGSPYRKTPVFRAEMRYLEFNPTWTVPPTIQQRDILPKAKADPSYLTQRHIRILDPSGNVVPLDTIDWASLDVRRFPYILRQAPGPQNALGRVKFMFPNAHFVYLHDTPSKNLFERDQRAFSSGCIRVENPFELAELLLDDPSRWNADKIQMVLDSLQTQKVMLSEPIPVLILYWTAEVLDDGQASFRSDLYGRDAKLLAALDGPLTFSLPADAPAWLKEEPEPAPHQ